MRITFFGAAGEVTGSCSLVEAGRYKVLVDCGMFQGNDFNDAKNNDALPFDPKILTHVFITHAHLDHTGRLPLLVKLGYRGHFYATAPTLELAELVMRDAHDIMLYDNKKFGRPILYGEEDIAGVIGQGKRVEYGEKLELNVADSVAVTFHDVGHIFGSAFIEIQAEGKKIVFSGDIGNIRAPILRDTESLPANIDVLVCESTYGDRLHETQTSREEVIEQAILNGVAQGGVLMVPSFALERTQELIYELNKLIDHKHRLGGIPIYLDSPLAIDATKVFRKYPQYYDEKATEFFRNGDDIFTFSNLIQTYSREESMKINHTPGPKVIIAGAGMMNGGRILHHAIRYLSDPKNTILFIGYQSPGTLGRQIMEGQSPVIVHGERVQVRCCVKVMGALSAHGDQNKLVSWVGGGVSKPKKVYLNHGEPEAAAAVAKRLKDECGIEATPASTGLSIVI